jgi:hypothetical protein
MRPRSRGPGPRPDAGVVAADRGSRSRAGQRTLGASHPSWAPGARTLASFGCNGLSRRRRFSEDHTSDTDRLHSQHACATDPACQPTPGAPYQRGEAQQPSRWRRAPPSTGTPSLTARPMGSSSTFLSLWSSRPFKPVSNATSGCPRSKHGSKGVSCAACSSVRRANAAIHRADRHRPRVGRLPCAAGR